MLTLCGSSQISGTLLGVAAIRAIAFWALNWGPPILGNYHVRVLHSY